MLSQQQWKSPQSTILYDGNQIVLRLVIRLAGVSNGEEIFAEKTKYVEGLEIGSLIRDPFNQEFRRVK